MRLLIVSLVLLALCVPPARAGETLVIGKPCMNAHCSFPEFENLMREAYRRVGRTVVYSGRPMLRDLVDANSGAIDGSMGRTRTALEAYPNLVPVPVPIARTDIAALTVNPSIQTTSLDDLGLWRTGCLRGDNITQNLGAKAMNLSLFNTYEEMFRALEKGRIDLVLTHATLGRMAAETRHMAVRVSPVLHTDYLYHCLHRKHAALVAPLADALRAMFADGTARRMYGRYLSMYPEKEPRRGAER